MNDNTPDQIIDPDPEMTEKVRELQELMLRTLAEPVLGHDARLIILALIGTGANIAMAVGLPGSDFATLLRNTADQLEVLWPEAAKQYLDA